MKKLLLLLIIIVFTSSLLSGCSCCFWHCQPPAEPEILKRAQPQEEQVLRRKLDGAVIESEELANLYPVAIMVENSAEAWPLSGLDKAQIVIEAITESSIPRFVAVYATDQEIQKIGPVRSARPYFLDWIEPFAPIYMHVGGAPEALAKIKSSKYDLIDLDQFFHSQYYWRDTKWRYAPHNVYTSSALFNQALEDKELNLIEQPKVVDYQMWKYKNEIELEQRPEKVNDIKVSFTDNLYQATWKYNKVENNYIRWQDHQLCKMSDDEWIKAKNVIVQVNQMQVIDDVGRKDIKTLGEGQTWIFYDGQVIEGKWKKESVKQRTIYYDNQDNEIEFNGGTTWIEVIPDKKYLEF